MFRDHNAPQHRRIDDLREYVQALIGTVIDIQLDYHLHSDDWARTVYIDTLGVKTTEFDLSDEKKKRSSRQDAKARRRISNGTTITRTSQTSSRIVVR